LVAGALALISATPVVVVTAGEGGGALVPPMQLIPLVVPGSLVGVGAYGHAVSGAAWGRTSARLGTALLGVVVGLSALFLVLAVSTGFLRPEAWTREYPSTSSFVLITWYLWLWLMQAAALVMAVMCVRSARN
jgi:hypothetical protein